MTAKTKAPTTSLIKCTPDITRTQAMIAARTASKMPVNHKGEAAGEHIKTVNAIINAEKTCLLGKDLPRVSFGMTGGISNFSYGRGLFMIYLKTDTAIKPTNGAMIESADSHRRRPARRRTRCSAPAQPARWSRPFPAGAAGPVAAR